MTVIYHPGADLRVDVPDQSVFHYRLSGWVLQSEWDQQRAEEDARKAKAAEKSAEEDRERARLADVPPAADAVKAGRRSGPPSLGAAEAADKEK